MKLRFSLWSLVTVMVVALPASVYASPEPFYTCKVRPHPAIRADGYLLGEYIFNHGDVFTLEAYPNSPKGRLAKRGRHAYENKTFAFSYNPSTRKGTLKVKSDGTAFSCNAFPLANGRILEPAILRASDTIKSKRLRTLPTGAKLKVVGVSNKKYRNVPWLKVMDDVDSETPPAWQGYIWSGTVCINGSFRIKDVKNCARRR